MFSCAEVVKSPCLLLGRLGSLNISACCLGLLVLHLVVQCEADVDEVEDDGEDLYISK